MSGSGVGGKPFTVKGKYLRIERPRFLSFTWFPSWDENALETVVQFELNEVNSRTTVRLTHSGLTEASKLNHKGWLQILTWLQAYAESRT